MRSGSMVTSICGNDVAVGAACPLSATDGGGRGLTVSLGNAVNSTGGKEGVLVMPLLVQPAVHAMTSMIRKVCICRCFTKLTLAVITCCCSNLWTAYRLLALGNPSVVGFLVGKSSRQLPGHCLKLPHSQFIVHAPNGCAVFRAASLYSCSGLPHPTSLCSVFRLARGSWL